MSAAKKPLGRVPAHTHKKLPDHSRRTKALKQTHTPDPRQTRHIMPLPNKSSKDVEGLGGYQLGDCLGKGAFGSVYRALHWGSGETVAIKQIKLADLPKSELRIIMLEIDLLKNLNHPNIVKYHGFVKSSDSLYIILEYCENGSLHSICKNFGKFPENLVALYMSQVLHGLLYLHEQGVIHRDIKGANILTTKEGLVKLADFGVATKAQGLNQSSVVGTPYWMAPEVIELSGATTASDIWSLGCTVIELLDGKPPYHKLQPMPALFRIVNDDHPPLPEGASPACRDFLMQCFQKDPYLRVTAKKLLKHPWILSAKKADSVVPIKPTQFDQAVKCVREWNEALKSPMNSIRKVAKLTSGCPPKDDLHLLSKVQSGIFANDNKKNFRPVKPRLDPEKFRSSEMDTSDNWDADFASSISSTGLKLANLQVCDNFDGQLGYDKLKSMASFENSAPENNTPHESTPLQVENIDPFKGIRNTAGDGQLRIMKWCGSMDVTGKSSHLNHPHKLILQESQNATKVKHTNLTHLSHCRRPVANWTPTRSPTDFKEDISDDYSDLIASDDVQFRERLLNIKAKRSALSQLLAPCESEKSSRTSSLPDASFSRNTSDSSKLATSLNNKINPTCRDSENVDKSTIGIEKYAEDGEEDFSDIFGVEGSLLLPVEPESESERGTLVVMRNSKLSNNSWLGDDEDDDDPFAQFEERFDLDDDLQTNVARDRYARLCTLVEGLIGSLKTSQPEDILAEVSEQLSNLLIESSDLKSLVISSHGILPILEVLENCQRREIVLNLLRIVNMIILDNVEIQENLCFVGGIPIISKFSLKKYPSEIRLEAAAFVRQMYQSSTLTLQMFISCGGLNVLVEYLEEDLDTERDLVLTGVNGVWSVFELQGPTPKNDFCRILSRSSILYPLSLVLNRVLFEQDELSELIEGRIVNIFLFFSMAENHVKETIADRMVLKRVLKDLPRMKLPHQITMLKFIKNLSMLATTHTALQNSNAIEILTDLLGSSMSQKNFREISNQILNIMYNLCRLSKTRQEDAALSGIIPLLMRIVQTEWPLKEFALPILCDMAHSGKVGRKLLWQNKGLQFYITLLGDKYWQVTALDAIFIWLQEETARVEQHLLEKPFGKAIVDCFLNSEASADAFENLLEPLQKLLRLSPAVASHLANPDIFKRIGQKLHVKKAVVRLNLLRIVRSICDIVPHVETDEDIYSISQNDPDLAPKTPLQSGKKTLGAKISSIIKAFGLYSIIGKLAVSDSAVLVREMASELIKRSDEISKRTPQDGISNGLNNLTPSLTCGGGGVGAGPRGGTCSRAGVLSRASATPRRSSNSGGTGASYTPVSSESSSPLWIERLNTHHRSQTLWNYLNDTSADINVQTNPTPPR